MSVGGIAVFPADTVYGLACDAGDTGDVIRRLYALKRRPLDKPSAVMFFDLETALTALPELGARTREALTQLLPGQLTVLLPNPERRFPAACGEDPTTLGLRVANVPQLTGVRWPVLQSSANLAGGAEPRTLDEVPERLRLEADMVIDGGQLPGTPSTVVDLRRYEHNASWSIVRAGAVSEREIDAALHALHFDPGSYDTTIGAEIPFYDQLQEQLELASGDGARRILELGTGTGETARRLLTRHPDATLVGIDESPEMLSAARARLPAERVSLVVSRLEDPLPDGRFDLVASALAVHHLAPAEKRRLFGQIRAALSPDGRFVLADVIVPVNPADATIELTPGFDRPETLSDLIAWLAQAGLEVSVSWTHQDLAVLCGRQVRRQAVPDAGVAGVRIGHMSVDLPSDFFNRPLAEVDPEIAEVLAGELDRQQRTLEMIASENFAPLAVLEAQGSVLNNKYAEGYPGRRYYGGCEFVDIGEQLAIDRARALFGAEHANVQPHAGAQANNAVYHALLTPGDTLLGLELAHGGHLSHGMRINVSGKLYNVVAYHVDRETSLVDMDEVARLAHEHRPKIIVAGWSAYPRQLDFPRFREIADEVGAYLFVDMAHFAGLVAAGLHPSPVPYADVVTTTIHKTIGGGRGGMILCREQYAKKIDSAVFPGQQGGPLEHIIAGKAVALRIAQSDAFRERQQRTLDGARALAAELLSAGHGVSVLTGGTDVHLVLVDLRESDLDGKQAEDRLDSIGITVNRNAVPFDPRPPAVSSGLRIGSPALATRGLGVDDFAEVGRIIATVLTAGPTFSQGLRGSLSERTATIADRYPLYAQLGTAAAV
jgi:glycine hydroxymethyltransferase